MFNLSFSFNANLFDKLFRFVGENFTYLREDPRFLVMKFLARFIVVREWLGPRQSSQAAAVEQPAAISQVKTEHPLEQVVETLQEDGYYLGLKLTDAATESLLSFAFSTSCYGNRNPKETPFVPTQGRPDQGVEGRYRVASYVKDQEFCPVVLQLRQDPTLLAIAQAYLGHKPVYQRSELLWSFSAKPDSEICYTHFFHADINDYRNIKFFFYLNNVDANNGPHYYMKGTHKKRTLWHQLIGKRCANVDDQHLIDTYGADRIVTICGPKGSGFVGDPFCLHRGSDVDDQPRLLLQLEFSIFDFNSSYLWIADRGPNAKTTVAPIPESAAA